jgi:hypothetical protein
VVIVGLLFFVQASLLWLLATNTLAQTLDADNAVVAASVGAGVVLAVGAAAATALTAAKARGSNDHDG